MELNMAYVVVDNEIIYVFSMKLRVGQTSHLYWNLNSNEKKFEFILFIWNEMLDTKQPLSD